MKTSENELLIECGRLTYIVGCVLVAGRIKKDNLQLLHSYIPFIFLIDFTYRIIILLVGNKSWLDMYAWKSSLIFPDTNFIALVLLFYLVPLISSNMVPLISSNMRRSQITVILLLSCMSRGALVGFVLSYFRNFVIFLSLLTSIIIYYYLSLYWDDILGSLGTKIQIFIMSLYLLFSEVSYFLWGVGKIEVVTLSSELGQRFGGTTVGHTIFGVIVEQGSVWVLLVLTLVLRCVSADQRWRFLLVLSVVGFLALFPITYLGLLAIAYNNSCNIVRVQLSKGVRT